MFSQCLSLFKRDAFLQIHRGAFDFFLHRSTPKLPAVDVFTWHTAFTCIHNLYRIFTTYGSTIRSTQIHPAVTSDFNATEPNSFGSCTNTFHKSDVESVDKVKQAPQSLDSLRPSPSILRTSLTSTRKMLRGFSVGNS